MYIFLQWIRCLTWWEVTAREQKSTSLWAQVMRRLKAWCHVVCMRSSPAWSMTTRTSTCPGIGTWKSKRIGMTKEVKKRNGWCLLSSLPCSHLHVFPPLVCPLVSCKSSHHIDRRSCFPPCSSSCSFFLSSVSPKNLCHPETFKEENPSLLHVLYNPFTDSYFFFNAFISYNSSGLKGGG